MSKTRQWILLALVAAPVLVLVIAGAWSLVESGRLFMLGWLFPLSWGVAWLVSRARAEEPGPPPRMSDRQPAYWTPRDRAAGQLVDARIRLASELSTERLADPDLYLQVAVEMANDIARHYHPKSKDPFGNARIVEVVAALNLAFEDLEQRVEEYVPGSHLLTIDHWRLLARSPDWFEAASRVGQVVSTILQPLNLGRFLLAEGAVGPVKKRLKQNVLVSLHSFFLRELGFYLIEMNSGRLRRGSQRYRELLRRGAAAESQSTEVTVALVGQSGAGKSSLVNSLLGERQAETDVLPSTREVKRHLLTVAGAPQQLALLDTPGYGAAEDGAERARETAEAWRAADLVLLVMDVQNQNRSADLELLRRVTDELERSAHEKPPPVLGVLTHIDRLSPVLEWSPPYDWVHPTRPKEESIHQAIDYLRGIFGASLDGLVPVCADFAGGRVHGVQEELLPAMTALLGEAAARSMLRALHAELDQGRVERVFRQLRNAGRTLLRAST